MIAVFSLVPSGLFSRNQDHQSLPVKCLKSQWKKEKKKILPDKISNFFSLVMWWRSCVSPRHNFFLQLHLPGLRDWSRTHYSWKELLYFRDEGEDCTLPAERWQGGPGSVPVRSAVNASDYTGAAASLCASPCLHTTTPPTFFKETRSWL